MALTLTDLCYRLKQVEETELLELLNLTSEDIVDRFCDIIEDNFEKLENIMED